MISKEGRINTIIGDNKLALPWSPMPCKMHIPLKDVSLFTMKDI